MSGIDGVQAQCLRVWLMSIRVVGISPEIVVLPPAATLKEEKQSPDKKKKRKKRKVLDQKLGFKGL